MFGFTLVVVVVVLTMGLPDFKNLPSIHFFIATALGSRTWLTLLMCGTDGAGFPVERHRTRRIGGPTPRIADQA